MKTQTIANGPSVLSALALGLFCLVCISGCAIVDDLFAEPTLDTYFPTGEVIPADELPAELSNVDIPEGTVIKRCNGGQIFRLDYPDGQIRLIGRDGSTHGGVF